MNDSVSDIAPVLGRLMLRFPEGVKDIIKDAATAEARNLSSFCLQAIYNELIAKGYRNRLSAAIHTPVRETRTVIK